MSLAVSGIIERTTYTEVRMSSSDVTSTTCLNGWLSLQSRLHQPCIAANQRYRVKVSAAGSARNSNSRLASLG